MVVVLLPLSLSNTRVKRSTTQVAAVDDAFDGGHTTTSSHATRGREGSAMKGQEGGAAVLSQSLIDLRAVMSLALPARRCYQSSRD